MYLQCLDRNVFASLCSIFTPLVMETYPLFVCSFATDKVFYQTLQQPCDTSFLQLSILRQVAGPESHR